MELPDDILKLIKEYSMPVTRPDWRKGCYCNRQIFYRVYFILTKGIYQDVISFKYLIYRKAQYIEGII
jgi:hypothetical protein